MMLKGYLATYIGHSGGQGHLANIVLWMKDDRGET